jgi:HSP20 family protein
MLTVSGEKNVERIDEKIHYTERNYGTFTRAFNLPSDADRDGITANFAKGVLTLQVPKSPNSHQRAKEIEVMPS